jgi:hypothetical protein
MSDNIIQFPKQLELPLKWWDVDWSHGGVITDILRPTEDAALENVGHQARLFHSVGRNTFLAQEWVVYFKDLELQFRYKKSNCITALDIAKALKMPPLEVEDILRRIDGIMTYRDLCGMPMLPPIPFEYLKEANRIKKLKAA